MRRRVKLTPNIENQQPVKPFLTTYHSILNLDDCINVFWPTLKMRNNRNSRHKKKYSHKKHLLPGSNRPAKKNIVADQRFRKTAWQVFNFAIVGGLATATHTGLFIFMMETHFAKALQANFIAFSVAFLISFLGQYHWTFRNSGDSHWAKKMAKFMVVALIGLGLNTSAVYIIVDQLLLSYNYAALFMSTVVPATTFIINKKWAFT